MIQPVYILSASIIAPPHNYEDEQTMQHLQETDNGMLYVSEPNYRKYINPVAIRRMSKLLKMGISTGMNALEQAGVEKPDAIIAGTGRGSMSDTERFLMDMIQMGEEALTPTSFIQSTYNSVNGWLALQTKSNGYNQTYVNRGTSLELSLFDAQMFINEHTESCNVLAGSFDEITEDYVKVKGKIGYWKQPAPPNLSLYEHGNTPGTIAGEGAAFFVLSNDSQNALCRLTAIKMMQDADDAQKEQAIDKLLADNNLSLKDIDVLIVGMSGDIRQQSIYDRLNAKKDANTSVAAFKHLCGEYDTSSGFALWMATEIFKTQQVPAAALIETGTHSSVKNVLIVNHYILNSSSLILLQSAQ